MMVMIMLIRMVFARPEAGTLNPIKLFSTARIISSHLRAHSGFVTHYIDQPLRVNELSFS
jgi:hypothetical protein